MLTPQQKANLKLIAQAAVQSEKATGLPAELTAAQCIFESAWLTRAPGNNCFGIMPDHHGAGVQYCASKEFLNGTWLSKTEAFERYNSLGDCFTDHARLITEGAPYAKAWQRYVDDDTGPALSYDSQASIDKLIKEIGPIYGTDPNYAAKILAEAHSATMVEAIKVARTSS